MHEWIIKHQFLALASSRKGSLLRFQVESEFLIGVFVFNTKHTQPVLLSDPGQGVCKCTSQNHAVSVPHLKVEMIKWKHSNGSMFWILLPG